MIACDPQSLINASICLDKLISPGRRKAVQVALLCSWANAGGAPPCTLPTAPVDLGVVAGDSENTLSWPAGAGATGYNIKRSLVTGGPYTVIGTSAASPYVDNTAVNGTEYFYVVSSTNACGESVGNSIESHGTPGPVPVIISVGVITGTVQVGYTLSGSNGTWTNSPTGYTYRWLAGGVAIVGATANTFLLTTAQQGQVMTFEVTASNAYGSSVPATSAVTNAVLPAVPVNSALPVITGTPQDGQTLSGSNGTWTNSPTGYTYQWLANGTPISGATANTYLLTIAQLTQVITFQVTASNSGGSGAPATSSATSAVTYGSDRWYFSNAIPAPSTSFAIAFEGAGTRIVDWGDGNIDTTSGNVVDTHVYASAQTYTYSVRQSAGATTRLYHYLLAGSTLLTGILTPPNGMTGLTDLSVTFAGCSGLTGSIPSLSTLTALTKLAATFYGCSGLTGSIPSLSTLTGLTDLANAFYGCSGLTGSIPSLSTLTALTDLSSAFPFCSGLTGSIPSLSTLTALTDLSSAFYGCSGLTGSIPSLSTLTALTDLSSAFYGCSGLTANTQTVAQIFGGASYPNLTSANSCFFLGSSVSSYLQGNAADFISLTKNAGFVVGTGSGSGSYQMFHNQTTLTDYATTPAAWK